METETITVPKIVAQRLRAKVDDGTYADEIAVIVSGLTALDHLDEDHVSSQERWLTDEVVPIALRMDANPDSGFSTEEVLTQLRQDMQAIDRKNAA